MKIKKIVSSVVLASILLLSFPSTAMAVTVSSPADIDTTHVLKDMVVDSSGNVHAVAVQSISGGTSWDLKYMRYSGGSWTTTTIDTGTPDSGYSYYPKIALDSSGKPGIAWSYWRQSDGSQYLYYIKFDGNNWGTKVEVSADADMDTPSGSPALAFYKSNVQGAADLDYATIFTCNGVTYGVEQHKATNANTEPTFSAPTEVGAQACSSVEVDIAEADTIMLVTSARGGAGTTSYSYYHDGSSWGGADTVFTAVDAVNGSEIHMKSDNNSNDYHVVMIDNVASGDDKILYNFFTGGSWAGQETITGTTGENFGSAQIDVAVDNDNDIPYVFYFDNANGSLEYSYKVDGSWTNGEMHSGLSFNAAYFNYVAADYDAGNTKIVALGSFMKSSPPMFDFNKYELTDLATQSGDGVPEFSTFIYTITALMLFGMVYWKNKGGRLQGA